MTSGQTSQSSASDDATIGPNYPIWRLARLGRVRALHGIDAAHSSSTDGRPTPPHPKVAEAGAKAPRRSPGITKIPASSPGRAGSPLVVVVPAVQGAMPVQSMADRRRRRHRTSSVPRLARDAGLRPPRAVRCVADDRAPCAASGRHSDGRHPIPLGAPRSPFARAVTDYA